MQSKQVMTIQMASLLATASTAFLGGTCGPAAAADSVYKTLKDKLFARYAATQAARQGLD